ncbi:hypothetical protein GO755_06835 [Spirosoma sp. HMF4905]|uniref:DoxX family protein n=1 Tax=Spirosoma arboris TaxID=2682092 RepID=A0A7K1S7D2_9BACT|nr:hypothetical protein [Spirosoma arboris]MVM29741.1 hypothetical protein [Spirosoma arboris]
MKIISGILILITVFFSIKHGWAGITNNVKPEEAKLFTELGFGKPVMLLISILTLAVGLLVLFPQTFFSANLINAAVILLILAFQVKAHNMKAALIEIPFLLMPLIMIYLGHPLKK